ncbi:MAG: acyl-CoA carboxylase subunit beta, partial [Calditrichaeota bacterium]
MKKYISTLDPRSDEFRKRKNQMLDLLSTLNLRSREIKTPRPEAVEKLRARGKYPAREKIKKVLDPGTPFHEIGLFAAYDMYKDIPGGYPAAGTIVGVGTISGKKVVLMVNDPLVKSGAWVEITCKKNLRAQEIAMENRLPIVYMVDSAGVNLERQAEIFPDRDHFGRIFRNNAVMAAMGIPQISCVFGFCVAGGAYLPGMSSELAMISQHSSMFLAGPFLVRAALGQDVDLETLGGAAMHNQVSGVADYRFDTEDEAFQWIRDQVALLGPPPPNPFDKIEAEEPAYDSDELLGILPHDMSGNYEAREIIARLVDGSRFQEFKPEYGLTIVTAFARMGGYSVG